jgi:hypothetical protein
MPTCLVPSTRRDGLKGHDGGTVPHYKLMAQDALWPLVDVSCGVAVYHKDARIQIVEEGVSRQE